MVIKFKGKKVKGMPENCCGRSVGISNNDTMIVVGMKGGACWVLSCNKEKEDLDLKVIKTINYAKRWISEIKFSPNDELCAVGDHQQKIWIYKTQGTKAWKRPKKPL